MWNSETACFSSPNSNPAGLCRRLHSRLSRPLCGIPICNPHASQLMYDSENAEPQDPSGELDVGQRQEDLAAVAEDRVIFVASVNIYNH